jgi:hypothetical protein
VTSPIDVAVEIPSGYLALPLHGIDDSVGTTESLLREVGPSELTPAADEILPAMGLFLHELARVGVRYCGLGRHLVDSRLATSVLTVVVYDSGDTMKPRLALESLADAKPATGDLQLVDLDNRPLLFFEQVRNLPVPDFPGNPTAGTTAPVYQLEATMTSTDGTIIGSVELSTPFVDHAPQFRRMIIDVARSMTLQKAAEWSLDL